MDTPNINLSSLKKQAFARFIIINLIIALVLCLSAWNLKYWEAWAFIIVLGIPMFIFGVYIFKHDPAFLERRMRTKETRKGQKLIIKLSILPYLLVFIIPGFDKRLGWSEMPLAVKIIGLICLLFSYLMILKVFLTNSYAGRVVEVVEGQKVISTGPYKLVRHPMYLATILLYLFAPLALGSYWAMIPTVLFLFIFVPRIKDEEKELLQNLEGYTEYVKKTKYRLLPFIW